MQARHTRFHLSHAGAAPFRSAHLHSARSRRVRSRVARRFLDHQVPGPSVPTAGGGVAVREQTGGASFYRSSGRTAAGGRVGAATCAHRTLPFGTKVLVTNLGSGRQAVLTVNDRGPFVRGRIVDVSAGAAGQLGMINSGTAHVRLQVLAARREE